METQLRTAIGQILAGSSSLTSLLKSGPKSIVYGVNPQIDAQSSIPFLRFFFVGANFDARYLETHKKATLRMQVDAYAVTHTVCESIQQRSLGLLAIPSERKQPINTQDWSIDLMWLTGGLGRQDEIDLPGGGGRICALSRDWSLRVTKRS